MPTLVKVPVTKSKGGAVEIDVDAIPPEVFQAVVIAGLKDYLNRGMSKISVTGLEGEALEAAKSAAMEKAEKNRDDMLAGKTRITGQKAEKGASGAVMTEARRLAKGIIKDAMKRKGIKVSYVPAPEITKAANAYIATHPEIVEQAKAMLAEREAATVDIELPAEDEKKIAAAEAKKKSKPLSAAQAGKTKKSKPQAQANA